MLNKVQSFIDRHNLLDKDKRHIVALSGGADSVCLLLILRNLGYKIHAAHCNFKLRGEESERDEAFCKNLCKSIGVELHLIHFDTKSYAQLHKVSIEMAARELRYTYFEALRKSIEAEDILVAHHKNDNVETLLLNLLRGTGIKGLEGIKPRNGRIIRPLLCLNRLEIEEFLRNHNQSYVTDSTNFVADVKRNKIRLNVVPVLEDIVPAASDNIIRTIQNVGEASKMLNAAVERAIKECTTQKGGLLSVDIDKLKEQPSPEYVLYSILSPMSFTSAQIYQIVANIDGQTGKIWTSSEYTLVIDRGCLLVCSNEKIKKQDTFTIPEVGNYRINENIKIELSVIKRTEDFLPSKDRYNITVDADRVSFPLKLRQINKTDRFIPYGMNGSKLISDYLTDRKRNYFKRLKQLVLEDANGNIMWLVGERVSQRVACSNHTINIMNIRYITDEE